MITPEQIKKKAAGRYREVLADCLDPDPNLFPMAIPFRKPSGTDDLADVIEAVRILRDGSKEVTGHGYTVEWVARRSTRFGTNQFPQKIQFTTREDYLRFLGRNTEFKRYQDAVRRVIERFPQLLPWLKKEGPNRVEWLTQQGLVEGLLAVTEYVYEHPRCGLFPRELPVAVDTKFVERNRAVLVKWWDLVLPPGAIEPVETHFERRFGLGYPEILVEFRHLDGRTSPHFALPLTSAAEWSPEREVERVIIVENRVNFLTLPHQPGVIAMAGMGGQVQLFRYLSWLAEIPVYYWGDIDAQGFEILGRLRRYFPKVQSILMDGETLIRYQSYVVEGKAGGSGGAVALSDEESALYEECSLRNLRLEQEKIPQEWVTETLRDRFSVS